MIKFVRRMSTIAVVASLFTTIPAFSVENPSPAATTPPPITISPPTSTAPILNTAPSISLTAPAPAPNPSRPTHKNIIPRVASASAPPPLQNNIIDVDSAVPNERLISLNFTNIKTQELLQVISQFVGINFVVSDAVKGSMSINLRKVPWEDAMQVILKSQGLSMRRMDNVIYVAPLVDLTKYEVQALQAKEEIQKNQPLNNMVIHLQYADAESVFKTISTSSQGQLLSDRGKISFDKRTNSLWLSDTSRKLAAVREMISRLDRPVKQVMIEARIVEIDQNYESEIGIRFGLTSPINRLSGTLNGANQILAGTPPTGPFTPLDPINPQGPRLNFDLPAEPAVWGAGRAGTIAVALARFGQSFVDLELSALEREGKVQLVSSPRLVTSDLAPAYIQTGEQIPYQQATSSGATAVEFVQATLSLKVTPQLTPDCRVIMRLTVTNNQALPAVPLSGGGSAIPISTQEEQSVVLVNDKQTIVLGGVYTQNKQNIVRRIPFLGKLPLIGVLFRNTFRRNDRTELLIFLTPHIIYTPKQLSQE